MIATDAPSTPSRRKLSAGLFAAAIVAVTLGSAALLVGLVRGSTSGSEVLSQLSLLPPAAAFSVMGFVVARREPRNACGWLMLVIGLVWSLGVSPQTADGTTFSWATAWGWVLPFGLMATHLLLRLPNGRLLSRRWRWVSRLSTLAIGMTIVGFLFDPSQAGNPIPNETLATLAAIGIALMAVCAIVSISSLVLRARRAGAEERHQIRWIAIGGSIFLATWLGAVVLNSLGVSGAANDAVSAVTLTFYAAVPICIGIAILRYRLYDIDVVIRKTLVVAVIAAFFVLVYALVVGGIGALLASSNSTALSFAAAAIVAALFQPVLARARRFADRFVYGKRATPYEVLAEFGEHLAGTYSAQEVLPRTARVLAEGVGADRARVWLEAGGSLRPVATWPPDADPGRTDDHRAEVRHQGELLGALSVALPANDPIDPAKEKLIEDLAAQAGLVLRNVRLVEDLRGSARRLVAAQDEERRRLERNIHDGAQQQLVALTIKARLARGLTGRDPAKAAEILGEIEGDSGRALEDLRALARGIYPPLLADRGLATALEAQARRSPVPVTIHADGLGRYPQEVEAAVYFSVLEALQNVAKYAGATAAGVTLGIRDERLRFEVRDDGRGFDPGATGYGTGLQGIADRLTALDGRIEVTSAPGAGATVAGTIPLPES